MTKSDILWVALGLSGQLCFFMRFFIQWLVSERRKKSTIPIVFWYLSIAGAAILLVYAVHRRDPVFIIGQSTGMFIYLRNLILIKNER